MKTWLTRALIALVGLAAGLVLLTVLINSFDQKIEPQVQAVLDKDPAYSETQKRAYYYLLGLHAGERKDPEKKGEELWAEREQPGFWTRVTNKELFAMKVAACPQSLCTVQALNENPELAEELKANQETLNLYIKLLEYGEGATLFLGDENTILTPFSALPLAPYRWLHLQMAEWIRRGGELRVHDLLISSNTYARSFLKSGTLFERMVALVMIAGNADFLLATLEAKPKFPLSHELLESFNIPSTENMLFGALDVETKVFHNALRSIHTLGDLKLAGLDDEETRSSWLGQIPLRVVFKPNQTLNKYYEITSQALTADCGAMDMMNCVPAARWAQVKWPWQWIDNPMGRFLVRIFYFSNTGRAQKIEARRQKIAEVQDVIRAKMP